MQKRLKKFLHDLIAELLGLPGNKTVWLNQNMPKLKKPYATLHLYSQKGEVSEEIRLTGQPGVVDVFVPTTAKLEVQLYECAGEDTTDKIENMVRKLEMPSIVDKCSFAKVAFFDAGPVNDLTGLVDEQTFEPRAAVDLDIRYNSVVIDDVGVIEQVNIHKTDKRELYFEVKIKEELT